MRALSSESMPPLELWGGVECTINRVGDRFCDQFEMSGHAARLDDLDRLAALGLKTLRYPILWESVAPDSPDEREWRWADERLGRLRELGITPIVGFVHHGSGPRYTDLVDDRFPTLLAQYARAFAERYPWVRHFTPVNEPLTTARFSGLYGHWYPHGRDAHTFGRALLTQMRGVVLAMRAVREVIPDAQVVQTEDLGETFSTPRLAYQAEFENERRWLTWDLLGGRLTNGHPVRSYMDWSGISEGELAFFSENPCPPDMLGINHYVTSNRYLDDRVQKYPPHLRGGNAREQYVDVEAVRAHRGEIPSPAALLREAWERYGIPIAVTEAHLACTREEQLRWLHQMWNAAGEARASGAQVSAVTAWSLLGAYGWNRLLTGRNRHYEPGAFDLRDSPPRPTALAGMVQELSGHGAAQHPVLGSAGWWQRDVRFLEVAWGEQANVRTEFVPPRHVYLPDAQPPLLITGATGTLGQAFARLCYVRGLPYRLLSREAMDIADEASVARALGTYQPWAVVNAAGFSRVDDAEEEAARCFRENAEGAAILARACAEAGVRLATFSSDLVFDGTKGAPSLESDAVSPLSAYGRSKAEAEARVLSALPAALVIRTSAIFGPWDQANFITTTLSKLRRGEATPVADDAIVTPTYLPDLVHVALDLLIDGASGLWHLTNGSAVTWAELVQRAAQLFDLRTELLQRRPQWTFPQRAERPRYRALGTERGQLLPTLEDALLRYRAANPPIASSPAEEIAAAEGQAA